MVVDLVDVSCCARRTVSVIVSVRSLNIAQSDKHFALSLADALFSGSADRHFRFEILLFRGFKSFVSSRSKILIHGPWRSSTARLRKPSQGRANLAVGSKLEVKPTEMPIKLPRSIWDIYTRVVELEMGQVEKL